MQACAVQGLGTQSRPTLRAGCNLPALSVRGDSPGKNAGVGCHALLQGNLPDPGIGLRDRTQVSRVAGRFFAIWAIREAQMQAECRAFVQ